jgi:hypothetical protein
MKLDFTCKVAVDRARWHKSDAIREFPRKHRRLRIVYLPPYQPALNMQERIWRQIRYESTTNRWLDNLDVSWATVQKTLDSWSKHNIKRLCTLLSAFVYSVRLKLKRHGLNTRLLDNRICENPVPARRKKPSASWKRFSENC